MIKIQKYKLLTGICSFSVFLVLTIGLFSRATWFEEFNQIGQKVIQQRSPLMDKIMINVTQLGNAPFIILMTILLFIIFLYRKNYVFSILIIINVFLFGGVITQVIKRIIQNPRPEVQLISEHGYSFPSGHAMISILFYGTLLIIIKRYVKNGWVKIFAIIFTLVILMLIPISRIYVNVHYPSDIVAGLSLGYSMLLFSNILFLSGEKNDFINRNTNSSSY